MKAAAPILALVLLAGCVTAPPPMIAFPGQGKAYPQFQADDAACRAGALAAARATQTTPGAVVQTPNLSYSQCMVARGNRVGGAPPPVPVYQPVPVYPAYDPYLYGGGVGFGVGF